MVFLVESDWLPGIVASIMVVASVDARPDSVEDVLNVCPHQAKLFCERLS